MRIVIPVSAGDTDLALKLLQHLGDPSDSSHKYPATLVLSPLLVGQEKPLVDAAEKAFSSCSVKFASNEDTRGWPWAPNRMFSTAIEAMAGRDSWLWLEPDCTPLTRDWLDQIATEYNIHQKPYLGTLRDTVLRDKDGVAQGTDGRHMIGVGVYPGDMAERSLLWKFFDSEPFDVYLRWEVTAKATESELIAHNWRSTNFRGKRGESLSWDGEDQTPIPAKSVLHHGCKDGSLLGFVSQAPSTGGAQSKKKPSPETPVVVRTLTLPDDE